MIASKVYRDVGPRAVRKFTFSGDAAERTNEVNALIPHLRGIGIDGLDRRMLARMIMEQRNAGFSNDNGTGMDSDLAPLMTAANIVTPIQFLQTFLTGFVNIITAAREIDNLIGMITAGEWEGEEVIQGVLEQTGTAVPYGDLTNVPFSSWNSDWERRTIVRFEEGMFCGVLEEARASKVNVNSAEQKRGAATLALEINRNMIGFYGYNSGLGRTFGFLNDPNLPAATEFPATGSGSSPAWADKNFQQIQTDLRGMFVDLRTGSNSVINPTEVETTLALSQNTIDFLTTTTDQGISVLNWLNTNYPKCRVKSAPELDFAINGDNEAYLYAETVEDGSTDDKRTFAQIVPTKFRLLGVQAKTKGYEEDYSNATAGVLLKRPYAVVRRYGN